MPIDYLSRLRNQESDVDAFLSSRDVPRELAGTRSRILTGRNKFLGDELSGVLNNVSRTSNLNPMVPQTGYGTQKLQSALDVNLAENNFSSRRNQLAILQERISDKLTEAGYDRRQAEAYATQYVNDVIRRQSASAESERERSSKRSLSDAADSYVNRGLDLEDRYQPQSNVSAALARVLAGGLSSGLTAYSLYKQPRIPSVIPGSRMEDYTGLSDIAGNSAQSYRRLR